MKNTKSSTCTFLVCAIFTLLTGCSFVRSDTSLISKTCEQTPYYDLCVTSLKSDKRSYQTDDTNELAIIMVDIVKAKATVSQNFIRWQIRKRPGLKKQMISCAQNYNAVLTADIPEALEALQNGVPKFAQSGVNDAANEANSCEANFHGKSPMTQLNTMVHHTSTIASAIISLLL